MTDNTATPTPPATKPPAKPPTDGLSAVKATIAKLAQHRQPPLRAPKKAFPYRTLKEMLFAWRFGLIRLGVAVVILVMLFGKAKPFAEGLVEEQFASGAVAKGRVLMRGAQQVATTRLTEFMQFDEAESYITLADNLDEVATAAKFEVAPVEIVSVSLNDRGLIEQFGCVVDYEYRRYRIEYDLTRNVATPTLLETLEKPTKTDKE